MIPHSVLSTADTQENARAIPLSQIIAWAIFGFVLFALFIYFVGAEQGAVSVFSGHYVHEFVHDGRHILGFPCH